MPRPDRSHYVIDLEYDTITKVSNDGSSPSTQAIVLQVWVDPAFPDAYRAPELRAYMLRMAERYGVATIVRYSSRKAITVVPPPLVREGEWLEITDHTIVARTPEEKAILNNWQVEVGYAP